MLSPTVVVPVSLVGAITRRPLVQLKVIVFGATGASLPTVNVPSVSVGRLARLNTPQRGDGGSAPCRS